MSGVKADKVVAIIPWINNWELTKAAAHDIAPQVRRLIMCYQGKDYQDREKQKEFAYNWPEVQIWNFQFDPGLPSLASTWDELIRTAFDSDKEVEAVWVCNNDIRVLPYMGSLLFNVLKDTNALFVSGVGCREGKWEAYVPQAGEAYVNNDVFLLAGLLNSPRGGPDFSCFMLSRECWGRFQFDPGFVPAYCEDLDYHRTLMLAGEGKRIFSVPLPFLHLSSQTLRGMSELEQANFHRKVDKGSRSYYKAKWGGGVNSERYLVPFSGEPVEGVTTPELQRKVGEAEEAAKELPNG